MLDKVLEYEGLLPQKSSSTPPYTLVLDMDETLIHFVNSLDESRFEVCPEDDLCFFAWPGLFQFIKEIKDYYEIVVFTAATKNYADWVLNQIDLFGNISHWLYRNHTDALDDDEE